MLRNTKMSLKRRLLIPFFKLSSMREMQVRRIFGKSARRDLMGRVFDIPFTFLPHISNMRELGPWESNGVGCINYFIAVCAPLLHCVCGKSILFLWSLRAAIGDRLGHGCMGVSLGFIFHKDRLWSPWWGHNTLPVKMIFDILQSASIFCFIVLVDRVMFWLRLWYNQETISQCFAGGL